MNKVIFAHPKEVMPEKTLMPGKPEIFAKLRDRDIEASVSLGAESAFDNTGVHTHDLIDDKNTKPAGRVALSDAVAIVNRLDRMFKYDEMPDSWVAADLPVLNENEMRSMAFRKSRVQSEVLEPLELGIETRLIESVVDAEVFMATNPADLYIAKPNSGTFSKGIERLTPDQVAGYFLDGSKLGKTILQPAFDFSVPMPAYLKPYDKRSEDGFKRWAQSDFIKELRLYGFYANGSTDTFPVGRTMVEGEDHWFFVDPETVPAELTDDTERVFERAARLTGSRAIYGALDIAYGAQAPDQDLGYHVVELNGRIPYMIGYDKHAGVADVLREKFADHISGLVRDDPKVGVK